MMRKPWRPFQPESSSMRQVAGVACTSVAPQASISRASATPSAAVAVSAMATVAPTVNGSSSSSTAMSNDRVVTAQMVSPAVMPGWCSMAPKKFTSARCGSSTPLGRPVEPDV